MTKKYRDKHTKEPVEIITFTANGKYPVVYQFQSDIGDWSIGTDIPIGHPDCDIEEVPPEPVKVGDSWEEGNCTYTVIAKRANDVVVASWTVDAGHVDGSVYSMEERFVRDDLDRYGAK